MESQVQGLLDKIGTNNPILELRKRGLSSKEIKNLFVSILEPYFEHRDKLGVLVSEFLAPEAVNVARIGQRPEKEKLLTQVLAVYRAARAANPKACFQASA